MGKKKATILNVEKRKTTYLLVGLVGALAILFIGLEWSTTQRHVRQLAVRTGILDEDEDMLVTFQQNTPPPPPPPAPEVITDFIVKEDNVEIDNFEPLSTEIDENLMVEVIDVRGADPVDEEECEDVTEFVIVENSPEFPGGEAALMAFIRKTLKYPAFAVETGIQGKVTVQFTIEKDGSVGNITILRSPADELSKEAIRVVSSMPKWKPGRQHGRAVRVRQVLPITFRLS